MEKASHCVYSMEGELCNKAAKQEDPNVLTIATVYQLALKLCAAKMLLSIRNLTETLMHYNVWDRYWNEFLSAGVAFFSKRK